MRLLIFAAVLVCTVLCGCTTAGDDAQKNVANSKSLRVGMTKQQVLEIMGEPLKDEVFCQPDLWYYYTGTVWADGLITADECTPLVFENGKLIGWGNNFLTANKLERRKSAKTFVASEDGGLIAKDKSDAAAENEEKTTAPAEEKK